MALVKKLQVGGPIDANALNEELNSQINTFNLKGKDEKKVRDHLVKFRDYFSSPEGKSFSVDPLTQKYTISGPGSEAFTGSPDEIHRNWLTGKLKIQNDQDAMSVAAAIYNKALNNVKGTATTPTTSTKESIKIGDLGDYVVKDIYGTENNFKSEFSQLKTDPEIKTKVLGFAKQKLQDYLTKAEQNKGRFNYEDVDKAKAALKSIDSGWDAFKQEAYKLKWEPSSFLLKPEQKAELENTEKTSHLTEAYNKLVPILGTSAATQYAQAGFEHDPHFKFDHHIDDIIRNKNGIILKNSITGKHLVLDSQGNPLEYVNHENPFDHNYGESWTNTSTGYQYFKPSQTPTQNNYYKAHPELFGDKYADKNVGRQLITNLPGKVYGWSGDEPTKDILGRRNFTHDITVVTNSGKKHYIQVSPGHYKDESGNIIPIDIKGYGSEIMGIQNWEVPSEFSDIPSKEHYDASRLNNEVKNITTLLNGKAEITADDKNKIKTIISSLKNINDTSKNHDEQIIALRQLSGLSNLLKTAKVSLKDGGVILKAQSGLKVNNYLEKYAKPMDVDPKHLIKTAETKSRDISGLVRGSSTLDKVDMAANAASLLPGFAGVAGATAATGIELYRDIEDPNTSKWKVAGDLALNLGLTAASFIGAGALRGVVKGAKIAREVGEGAKVLSEVDKVGKVAKDLNTGSEVIRAARNTTKAKEINESTKALNIFASEQGIQSKNLGEILSKARELKNADVEGHVAKVIGFTEELAKSKQILPKVALNAANLAQKAQTIGKFAAYGNAAMHIGGATDAAKKVLSGNFQDLTIDEVNSVTSVLFAGKVASHGIRKSIGTKYGIEPTKVTPARLETTINGKTVALEDKDLINKASKKIKIPFTKEDTSVKEALVKQYNEKLTEEEKPITIDDLKNLNKKDIRSINENKSGYQIKNSINLDKNYYLQKYGQKWASKYNLAPKAKIDLSKELTPERKIKLDVIIKARKEAKGTPSNKKGGILKYQTPAMGIQQQAAFKYAKPGHDEWGLPYTSIDPNFTVGTKVNNGEYSPEFSQYRDNNINDDWYNKNIAPLTNFIKQNNGTYFPKNALDVIRLAKDKKFGPVTAYISNLIDPSTSNKTNLSNQPTQPTLSTNSNNSPKTNGGIGIDHNIGVLPAIGKGLNWLNKNIDDTDLSNLAMYANTYGTNVKMGNEQRKGISDSLYSLPYMSPTYTRIDRPYTLFGNKQAASLESKANRVANSTSDIDKSMATKLSAIVQSNGIQDKAQMSDQQRVDQLRAQQVATDAKTQAYNIEVLGKNRGLTANAFKNIHLINSNEELAQNTATNNLIRALAANEPVKLYKANQKVLYDAYSNPDLKKQTDVYNKFFTEEGQKPFKDLYEADKVAGGSDYKTEWEQSSHYKDLQNAIQQVKNRLDALYRPIQNLQLAQQYQQPLLYTNTQNYKTGGVIDKEEVSEVKKEKTKESSEHKENLKEVELEYKAILHDNEMLQKTLIKVFK